MSSLSEASNYIIFNKLLSAYKGFMVSREINKHELAPIKGRERRFYWVKLFVASCMFSDFVVPKLMKQ